AGLDQSIAIREKKIFVQNKIENVKIHEEQSLSVGNAITCFKGLRGSYVPGEKGKRAEIVAQEALDNLNNETAEVDLHLADQLVIYGALAKGETEYSTSEISSHLRTNVDVVSRFLDRKIEIKENKIRIC
ncbi:MAG: RNA 3'-terminal phosphate cyclase, partial [Candidatus Micrarchaeota archaeon]